MTLLLTSFDLVDKGVVGHPNTNSVRLPLPQLEVVLARKRTVFIRSPQAIARIRSRAVSRGAAIDNAHGRFLYTTLQNTWQGREADDHHACSKLGCAIVT